MVLRIVVITVVVALIIVAVVLNLPGQDVANGDEVITNGNGAADNGVQSVELILSLNEISLEEYQEIRQQEGYREDPVLATAEQVGTVTLNEPLLGLGILSEGDSIILTLFDTQEFKIEIDSAVYNEDTLVTGYIEGAPESTFQIKESGDERLITLDVLDENIQYIIVDNVQTADTYIYKIEMIEYDDIEDEPLGDPQDS